MTDENNERTEFGLRLEEGLTEALALKHSDDGKVEVELSLDQDVLDYFKSGGPGWQSRVNDALRRIVGL